MKEKKKKKKLSKITFVDDKYKNAMNDKINITKSSKL